MKKIIVIILLLPALIRAQNYASLQVKEFYDATVESENPPVMPIVLMESLLPDDNNDDLLGDRISKVLSSLLKMYETTGDKAYLIKFVKNSFIAQSVRNDMSGNTINPVWADNLYFFRTISTGTFTR